MEPIEPTVSHEPGAYLGTPTKSDEPTTPRLIRTMQNDVANAIKKQNETFVSIALAEEKKLIHARAEAIARQEMNKEVAQNAPRPRGRLIIVTIFILIIVAIVLAYTFILPKFSALKMPSISMPDFGSSAPEKVTPISAPAVIPLAPALVLPQYEKRFSLNKETPDHLFATIAVERTAGMTAGTIKNLYFTEDASAESGAPSTGAITANRLLSFTNASAPEILVRSLETPFMVGLLGEEGSSATPFIILKVSSYETGFAGMIAWETSLPIFFDTIFGTRTVATNEARFRDVVVAGKDTRILDVISGITVAYTFADPETIVIAGSRGALEKLLPMVMRK